MRLIAFGRSAFVMGNTGSEIYDDGENTMSKSQDAKKTEKKEPLKTLKEKKAEKKIKKEERKRQ